VFRYRSQRIAFVISILIHILILLVYRPLARIDLFPDRHDGALARVAEPIIFELVETPDDAIRQRPEEARLLSDKDALARDEYTEDDRETGDAYSEGQVPYRVFSGRSELVGAEEQRRAEEREGRNRDRSSDPPRGVNPDAAGDDAEPRRLEAPPALPQDYLSRQAAGDPLSMGRQFSDDLDFDQRTHRAVDLGGITLNTYAWDYASYIFAMKRKLRSNTHPPAAFSLLGMISGEAVLRFKVLKDGTAIDISVLDYTGHRSLMETSMDAVRLSSPFRPLPKDFSEEYLELTWTFIYSVYR
jgi:hypothetical protein